MVIKRPLNEKIYLCSHGCFAFIVGAAAVDKIDGRANAKSTGEISLKAFRH